MKQKVVIKVPMNCQKCYSKALKIVVGVSGVESATLKRDDKSQIEVTGDNIDAVELTTALRKKLGHAEIVTENKAKQDEEKYKPNIQPMVSSYSAGVPHYQFYEVRDTYRYHDNPSCSIMLLHAKRVIKRHTQELQTST